jgi:hypothetical protein
MNRWAIIIRRLRRLLQLSPSACGLLDFIPTGPGLKSSAATLPEALPILAEIQTTFLEALASLIEVRPSLPAWQSTWTEVESRLAKAESGLLEV